MPVMSSLSQIHRHFDCRPRLPDFRLTRHEDRGVYTVLGIDTRISIVVSDNDSDDDPRESFQFNSIFFDKIVILHVYVCLFPIIIFFNFFLCHHHRRR